MSGRVFYRSRISGDLGYLIEDDGKQKIRLDRSGPPVLKDFDEHSWQLEEHRHPLNKQQLGKLTYDFDALLSRALGQVGAPRKDWASMQSEDRSRWMAFGPEDDGIRAELFEAVLWVLERYAGE